MESIKKNVDVKITYSVEAQKLIKNLNENFNRDDFEKEVLQNVVVGSKTILEYIVTNTKLEEKKNVSK